MNFYVKATKLSLLFLAIVSILSWLCHSSLNLYWQQTYHKESQLTRLDADPFWQKGDNVYQWVITKAQQLTEWTSAKGGTFGALPFVQPASELQSITVAEVGYMQQLLPTIPYFSTALHSRLEQGARIVPVDFGQVQLTHAMVKTQHYRPALLALMNSRKIQLHRGDTIFYVGDSLMQGVAPHLQRLLYRQYGINGVNLSKQSTGLAYPGFYNWPDVVEETLSTHPQIRLVIVFLGPNDPWDIPDGKNKPYLRFKSEAWRAIYQQRVARILTLSQQYNAQVIWVGAPNMKQQRLNQAMHYLNALYQEEVTQQGQTFIDINRTLGASDEDYVDYIVTEGDKKVKVRSKDGIHFTITGQKEIARKILTYLHVVEDNQDNHV